MSKAITVRDKHGKIVERVNGAMQDGDVLHVPHAMMDGARTVAPDTLTAGARILGDSYNPAHLIGLDDTAARHSIVKKRLGAVADGQPAEFLNAAWRTLAGVPTVTAATPVNGMTDAQRVVAAKGVKLALADAVARTSGGGRQNAAARDAADGARLARTAVLSDAWKGSRPFSDAALFDGMSYVERMAVTSGAISPPSTKPHERKVSDAEWHDRKRLYDTRGRA